MLRRFNLTLLALLCATAPALAEFEGILDMKVSMTGTDTGGEGAVKVAVSKAGARNEMNLQAGGMKMQVVMLFKNDTSNVVYRLDEANKTYSEIDLTKLQELAGRAAQNENYTVKKLGEEKILDYKTQHVLATGKESKIELWTAKDLLDYATFNRLQGAQGNRMGGGDQLQKALKDAGADGIPLKMVTTMNDGATVTMEVVKAEKKALPASLFQIPPDFKKSTGGMMGDMPGMSSPDMDALKKQMEDALKNLTPEQREMMEKMMKQRGVGAGQ
jgi:outer membrane lipoprotein-sorting protein